MATRSELGPRVAWVTAYLLAPLGVVLLASVFLLEMTFTVRALSATWDEPGNILAGIRYWQTSDWGTSPEHPPLAKLLEALPLLRMRLRVPPLGANVSHEACVIAGRSLLSGHDGADVLFRARLAVGLLGVFLVLLLWEAGSRMFAPGVGWLAAVVAIFEPNLLAHSALATTDFALATFCFAAVYALWRVAERPTALRLAGCGVACGMAFATKDIGILLIPTLISLAGVEVISGIRHAARGGPRPLLLGAVSWLTRLAVIGAVSLTALWGSYGFRYGARPEGLILSPSLSVTLLELSGGISRSLVTQLAKFELLPEAYLYGLSGVLSVNAHPRVAFLFGRLYPHAFWYYFPVSLLIKSTAGFLGLVLLALVRPRAWSGKSYRRAAYLLIPPALFLGASLNSGNNVGIRHVLPVYPFLILAAAAAAWQLAKRRRAWAIVVGVLLIWHAVSSLHSMPDYLAYSNELVGGTSHTYRLLSESNVDWGQGLREVHTYLQHRHIKDCWFAYYGSADPGNYQIPCKLLPDPYLWWWAKPQEAPPAEFHGMVLISATEMTAAEWGPAELNPYSQFLHLKPSASIGGSILSFEGDIDLRSAAAEAHMAKGWDLHRTGKPEMAMAELQRAAELAPNHPGPPSMMGTILAETHRAAEARAQLTHALELANAAHPEFYTVWLPLIKSQLNSLE